MTDNRKTTELLKADNRGLQRAATILKRGGLVAVPTETVYGLAARADRAESVAAIYAAKSRPKLQSSNCPCRERENCVQIRCIQ